MNRVIYTMQFEGELSPLGTSPNVMKASARCIRMTIIEPNEIQMPLKAILGEQVAFESDVTFLGGFESPEGTSAGEAGFKETGMITFGAGEHRLRFSTIGQGYIGPSAAPNLKQGAVMWQVESGEGQLNGAQGLITSNFLVSDAGKVTDHHMGVIFVP